MPKQYDRRKKICIICEERHFQNIIKTPYGNSNNITLNSFKIQVLHTNFQRYLRQRQLRTRYNLYDRFKAQLKDAPKGRRQSRIQRLKDIPRTGGEHDN